MTAPHLGPGHTIAGRYTVRARLGFSGQVATYHAVAPDGRELVVKLFDPLLGQRADVMAQLERVHAQLARMPPALVVAVLDSGYDTGTGAPFVATERLSIPPLERLAESQALASDVVVRILYGIGKVLDAADTVGLHHYALDPSNIFVGPAPDYSVRITDFGASVVRSAAPTHEAYALAAPWWAPEQLQPAAVLGPATDVFTVALVAFWALTGHSYWRSCQARPVDLPSWQTEIMGPRAPASQRAAEYGAFLPPALDAIFGRALSLNQSERPRSGVEIAQAVASVGPFGPRVEQEAPKTVVLGDAARAASAPALDAGVTPGLPPFRRVKRKTRSSLWPVAIGIASAAVLGGGGVAYLFLRSTPGDRGSAEQPSSSAASDSEPTADPNGATPADEDRDDAGAGSAVDAGGQSTVSITCIPACELLYVDNRRIDPPDGPIAVEPGRHTVKAVRSGYLAVTDTIEVTAGKPFAKEYRLVEIGKAISPKPKDCGQFLKPCK